MAFTVVLQAPGQRPKGAGHGDASITVSTGKPKALRQVGRAGLAVKEAHDAFNNDEVGVLRRIMQARAQSASPVIHRSSWYTGAPLARAASTGPENPARI
jgi:hypothetical protein